MPHSPKPLSTPLVSFGRTDALFRGTALSAIVLHWALLAMVPGFGASGVLFSVTTQLLITGMLEIPTSRIADHFGQARAVLLGAAFKIFVTGSLAFAVVFALKGNLKAAFVGLVLEAIFDSFANAFLSGAYQAAFLKWYEKQCGASGIPPESRPPLFLASFRVGLPLRLGLPTVMLAMGGLLFVSISDGTASIGRLGSVAFLLLGFVLSLRIFTLGRFIQLLRKSVAEETSPGPRTKFAVHDFLKLLRIEPGSLALFAFSSVLLYGVSLFCAGRTFKLVSEGLGNGATTWLIGAGLILATNTVSILIGHFFFPRLHQEDTAAKALARGSLFISGFALLVALLFDLVPSALGQGLLLSLFTIGVQVVAQGIQRSVTSFALERVAEDVRSTWLSVAESVAHLVAGLFFAAVATLSLPEPTPVVLCGMASAALGMVVVHNALRKKQSKSLRSYLGHRFTVAVAFVWLAACALDLTFFASSIRSVQMESRERLADLVVPALREPLMQGSFIEAKARAQHFIDKEKISCLEITVYREALLKCPKSSQTRSGSILERKLKFSSSGESDIGPVSRDRPRDEVVTPN